MRKFTKLWQLTLVLLLSTTVVFAQLQSPQTKDNLNPKRAVQTEMKGDLSGFTKDQKGFSALTKDQVTILEKNGITEEAVMNDKSVFLKAQELLKEPENSISTQIKNGDGTDAVSTYTFAQSSGTYTAITGTTSTASGDDGTQTAIPIGFNFVYDAATQTTFSVTTNGCIAFASSAPGYTNSLNAPSYTNILAPLWDDNNLTGGTIQYATTGSVGSRICTIQWTNDHIGGGGSTTNPTASFQIKLYETTNVIEFIYGSTSGAFVSTTASIGITGVIGNYLSVTPATPTATVSSTVANNSISSQTYFPSGTIYTFTPPTTPALYANPGTVACGYAPSGGYTTPIPYALSGAFLTSSPILVSAPANFEVSLAAGGPFTASVNVVFTPPTLASTNIWVRCAPTAPNTTYSGNITNVGGGASINVAVSGSSDLFTLYCSSIPSSTADEEIFSVTVNGATNAYNCTTVAPGPGSILNRYSNFYPLGSLTSLQQTSVVNFTILEDECDGATYYSNGCAIWIDFNQDGDWLDAGEQVYVENTTTQGPRTITGSIHIPGTATLGLTAMRIIVAESISGTGLTPCMTYSWGETEDYQVTITNPPACPQPYALTATNITITSADLGWTEQGSATAWEYQYGPAGFVPGATGTPTGVNPTTIGSLSANTSYDFYVRANCGGGSYSAWTGPKNFKTPCSFYTSLNENFDAVTVPAIPDCWFKYTSPLITSQTVTTVTTSPNSSPNCVQIYSYSATLPADAPLLITPYLSNLGAGTNQLRFYAKGASTNLSVIVGTMTDPANAATFTAFQTITGLSTTVWNEFTVSFATYSGSNKYIAFAHPLTTTYSYIYLDNVVWEVLPTCPAPSLLTVINITSSSADLGWTETGSATLWDIELGAAGFVPTGTPTAPNVATNPYTYGSLTGNTSYDFYVRAKCGGTSGNSSWSGPKNFKTACDPIAIIPWSENFDAMPAIGNNILPDCWLATSPSGTPWYSGNAASITYNDPCSTPNYVYVYYSPSSADKFLITPGFTLTAGTPYDFSFNWVGDGYSGWTGDVMVNTTQTGTGATLVGSSFVVAATTTTATCTLAKRTFAPATNGTYYFMVKVNNNGVPWDLGFDDFMLELAPPCPDPSGLSAANITINSANLTWTSFSGNSDIEFGLAGFTPTGVPTAGMVGITSPFTKGSLLSFTSYSFYVRDNCGGNGYSNWVGPYTFKTLCDLTCPIGSVDEAEPCGSDLNGGCNMPAGTETFTPVANGVTICGNTWSNTSTRDTDWFQLDVTGACSVSVEAYSATDVYVALIEQTVPGVLGCDNITGYITPLVTVLACGTNTLNLSLPNAGTYYFFIGPSAFIDNPCPGSVYYATWTVGNPVAVITPASFTKTLPHNSSTTDNLTINNTGNFPLVYNAAISYPNATTIQVYPANANYNTGTTNGTAFTETSLIRSTSLDVDRGWARFDLSAIPAGATITSVELHAYVSLDNGAWFRLQSMESDPLLGTPASVFTDIGDGTTYYTFNSTLTVGAYYVQNLGNQAAVDLQSKLAGGWFAVGLYEYEPYGAYSTTWQGWNEVNKPFLNVTYTTGWLTLSGAQGVSGTVLPGGSDLVIPVGFNSAGLAGGTYTANINITTNDPVNPLWTIPVTLVVTPDLRGNVYYGIGNTKPFWTNTTVTLTPVSPPGAPITVSPASGGAYVIPGLANGTYLLTGATTKAWVSDIPTFDATLILRYVAVTFFPTNLQLRAADVNMSNALPPNGVNTFDATLILRRAANVATPQWIAPNFVFDGPYPSTPALIGIPVTVSGADVVQDLRTLCSGDVNGSATFVPPSE